MDRIGRFKQRHHILFGLIRRIDVAINVFLHGTEHTLSAWYGKHNPGCILCRAFHKYAELWHCEKSALDEGLITPEEAEARMKGRIS